MSTWPATTLRVPLGVISILLCLHWTVQGEQFGRDDSYALYHDHSAVHNFESFIDAYQEEHKTYAGESSFTIVNPKQADLYLTENIDVVIYGTPHNSAVNRTVDVRLNGKLILSRRGVSNLSFTIIVKEPGMHVLALTSRQPFSTHVYHYHAVFSRFAGVPIRAGDSGPFLVPQMPGFAKLVDGLVNLGSLNSVDAGSFKDRLPGALEKFVNGSPWQAWWHTESAALEQAWARVPGGSQTLEVPRPKPKIMFLINIRDWALDFIADCVIGQHRAHYDMTKVFYYEAGPDKIIQEMDASDIVYVFCVNEFFTHRSQPRHMWEAMIRNARKVIFTITSPDSLTRTNDLFHVQRMADVLGVAVSLNADNLYMYNWMRHTFETPSFYTPQGLNLGEFRRNDAGGPPTGPLRVGWAGDSRRPFKGYRQLLVPAASKLDGVRIVAKDKGDQSNQPFTDMPSFYRELDVYVVSSESEGCPYPPLEALASGVPVISTFVGSMPEAIIDGYNGILLKDRTPEALTVALRTLRDNPALLQKLKNNAVASVQQWDCVHTAPFATPMFEDALARQQRIVHTGPAPVRLLLPANGERVRVPTMELFFAGQMPADTTVCVYYDFTLGTLEDHCLNTTEPVKFGPMSPGNHTLSVRVFDAAGTALGEAQHVFFSVEHDEPQTFGMHITFAKYSDYAEIALRAGKLSSTELLETCFEAGHRYCARQPCAGDVKPDNIAWSFYEVFKERSFLQGGYEAGQARELPRVTASAS